MVVSVKIIGYCVKLDCTGTQLIPVGSQILKDLIPSSSTRLKEISNCNFDAVCYFSIQNQTYSTSLCCCSC